jgi:hypothetical protein
MRTTPVFKMPAGTYYIGDLCYVMHDVWDEFCDITIDGHSVLDGVFSLKSGIKFATFCTEYGDGCYTDRDGREYGVDAGLIGCIRVEDIAESEAENIRSGNVVEFKHEFSVYSDEGVIHFGDVAIDTAGNSWDEDEDFDIWGDHGEDII